MNLSKLSKESTLYQYKLIKKITYAQPVLIAYFGFMLLYLIMLLIGVGIVEVLYMLIGAAGLHGFYALLQMLICSTQGRWNAKQWTVSLRTVWFGFIPKQHFSASLLYSLHVQITFIGLAGILSLIPWAASIVIINLLILHFWFMLPRLIILFIFSKHNKGGGVIKINQMDSGFYNQ
jgi:hypothetical protein